MTKIVFYKTNGIFYGFEEQGHTGYGEAGDDPLCAGISGMTMLIVNAIEVAYASSVDYVIDEQTTDIRVIAKGALPEFEDDPCKRFAVSGLIMAYFYQLNDMIDEYYDYLTVEAIERPLTDGEKNTEE